MWRFGWDYDRGYRGRGYDARFRGLDREPRPEYDRGYRGGWGMTGMNNAFLYGPRPEDRGYDHPIRRQPRWRAYDEGAFRSRGWEPRERPVRGTGWYGGYDRGWS